jgi:hypothetical protein
MRRSHRRVDRLKLHRSNFELDARRDASLFFQRKAVAGSCADLPRRRCYKTRASTEGPPATPGTAAERAGRVDNDDSLLRQLSTGDLPHSSAAPFIQMPGENRNRKTRAQRCSFVAARRAEAQAIFERVAEREGFEPPIGLHLCRISSAVRSTTLPPLQAPSRVARHPRSGGVLGEDGGPDKAGRGENRALARPFHRHGRTPVPAYDARAAICVFNSRRRR